MTTPPFVMTEDLIRWTSFGMNITWLSKHSGIPEKQLKAAIVKGTLKKPFGTKKALYCDYDFFRVIDTEVKAYWLGFLYADGCITDRGTIQVLLAESENDHLQKMQKVLNAEHPLEHRRDWLNDGKYSRWQETVKLRINSREMAADLAHLGIGPRKSEILTFPTSSQVPDHLLRHFIRGYFDGDGCICVYHGKEGDIWQCTIISTNVFCQKLGEVLMKEAGVDQLQIKPHPTAQNMGYLTHRRIGNVNRIRDYLYKDATVWLDRKWAKFQEVPVKYYGNKRDEIEHTIRSRLAQLGTDEVSTLIIEQLYALDHDSAWWAMKRLRAKGIVKKLRKQERYHIYKLT